MPEADSHDDEPPETISYSLDEALTLIAALEDARDALIDSRQLVVVVGVEGEIRSLSRKLGFDDPVEVLMSDTPLLRVTEAARRLGISTRDLMVLINERRIRFEMKDGIAHIPADAIAEYRTRAS